MATAPRPGSLAHEERSADPKPGSRYRLTFCGSTLEMPTAITFKEKFAVRAATGLPLEAFWSGENKIGEDSFLLLWWLARRYNGEPRLALEAVTSTWPDNLGTDDVDFEVVEDDEGPIDDPES